MIKRTHDHQWYFDTDYGRINIDKHPNNDVRDIIDSMLLTAVYSFEYAARSTYIDQTFSIDDSVWRYEEIRNNCKLSLPEAPRNRLQQEHPRHLAVNHTTRAEVWISYQEEMIRKLMLRLHQGPNHWRFN